MIEQVRGRGAALVILSLFLPLAAGVAASPAAGDEDVSAAAACPDHDRLILLGTNDGAAEDGASQVWKSSASGLAYTHVVRYKPIPGVMDLDVYKKTVHDCYLEASYELRTSQPVLVTQNINEEVYLVVTAAPATIGQTYEIIKA